MHEDDLRVYIEEIRHQRDLANVAALHLNDALRAHNAGSTSIPHLMAASQSILTVAAQVSKLLYADQQRDWTPERTAFALDRAASLRKALRPPKKIFERRAVRNAVEHYDAKMDDIAYESQQRAESIDPDPDGPLTFRMLVDIGVVERSSMANPDVTWVRNLDPVTLEYTAIDMSESLQVLINAIDDVAKRADAWISARAVPSPSEEEMPWVAEALSHFFVSLPVNEKKAPHPPEGE